ncbi:hypothetical protein ABZ567_25320 [Streptomyces sp. NPDC016459]|uniref:hypothetical protein n=1 Tax=Streptomyces sp. NPDC016459 TaxID=3157190 RepID=UPI003410CDA7
MKKILTAAALSCLAAAGLSGAGTAAADAGGVNLPSVVPLSGVLTPMAESADESDLPVANAAVERLLPGH